MPKLKPETIKARRAQILDAAEARFVRSGFHATTIQDICGESGLSAGALYAHFDSKEDLICGLAERESTAFAERLDSAASMSPDFLSALADIAEHYTVHEPRDKNRLFLEIGAEANRNPKIGATFEGLQCTIRDRLAEGIAAAEASGQIAPGSTPAAVAQLICILGDGLCMRRATDPDFDADALLPAIIGIISSLIRPVADREHPSKMANACTCERTSHDKSPSHETSP